MPAPPTLICLTPVKNEAWILDRFLQCASTWADHIIVADQQSDDETPTIARRYDKVRLIDNPHPGYDEAARQTLLIDAARQIPVDGRRVLLALDADEILTANWQTSPDWDRLRSAPPGTVITFQWANVGPNVSGAWLDGENKPFGFVDDGADHTGRPIHSPRIPVPPMAPRLHMEDIRVLHYQYANWARMSSKQRWYQCWERLNDPTKRPITIYRQYNFMHADVKNSEPLPASWLEGYERLGIDMRSIPAESHYHWDREILDLLRTHGTEPFRKLAIWDVDWTAMSRRLGYPANEAFPDPRSRFDRFVHRWLRITQSKMLNPLIRLIQKSLQILGW